MSRQSDDEFLAELFREVEFPSAAPDQRGQIFAVTQNVLQYRRRLRKCYWVASLAGCFLFGMASVLGWQSVFPPTSLVVQADHQREFAEPSASEGSDLKREMPQTDSSADDARTTVAPVPSLTLSTYEKLRRAGDLQLNQRGNLEGAIGCYRRALDSASDEDLQIEPERDSWLLMSLKEGRLEIRKHIEKKG